MSINTELGENGFAERTALIVYLRTSSDQFRLRSFGDIVYFSKKLGYCVIYVNKAEADHKITELERLGFVLKAEKSNTEDVNLDSSYIEAQITQMAAAAEAKLAENDRNLGEQA
ncbi:YlbG family protein [Lactobacillus corticis]|uniref:DUF2129 domain-containing protein n=1 Tax=Lactobacillus corticis TaxID=2201249 RepID=A0A916QJS5_9LACO|nr:YlbG family protein [Lactobacillus corticis]GFZ26928.1 hypothetical protein LCB40_08080 [Lactobacillus corticis]